MEKKMRKNQKSDDAYVEEHEKKIHQKQKRIQKNTKVQDTFRESETENREIRTRENVTERKWPEQI